ncbi:hypothetical protein [Fortiea contorta]|nr:hypothetical protein [Fortiea contorta]
MIITESDVYDGRSYSLAEHLKKSDRLLWKSECNRLTENLKNKASD